MDHPNIPNAVSQDSSAPNRDYILSIYIAAITALDVIWDDVATAGVKIHTARDAAVDKIHQTLARVSLQINDVADSPVSADSEDITRTFGG